MDVEAALRWAFRDELPKAANEGGHDPLRWNSGMVENYAQLLTSIDLNKYGCVPDLSAMSPPHPDAIALGEAVRALDKLAIGLPDDWDPVRDLDEALP
jgi:hypothetical protein